MSCQENSLSLSKKREKLLMVLKRKTISIFYSSQVAIIFQETLSKKWHPVLPSDFKPIILSFYVLPPHLDVLISHCCFLHAAVFYIQLWRGESGVGLLEIPFSGQILSHYIVEMVLSSRGILKLGCFLSDLSLLNMDCLQPLIKEFIFKTWWVLYDYKCKNLFKICRFYILT